MIQETCVEIGELEQQWIRLKEVQSARRKRIHYIDELIEEFEKLNLADEQDVPVELRGRAMAVIEADSHPLLVRLGAKVPISEYMDALYEAQDSLMFGAEDGD